jgi:colanic acid biosynthesis glycosyl transferase WcaI
MRILVLCQYYAPEEVGAGIWVTEMAEDLVRLGHDVTVATAFPNYPKRQVFEAYKGKKFQREMLNGVDVWRSYIYANPSESTKSRLLNWASFCASSCLSVAFRRKKHDVIYAIMPPLPLGMVAAWLALWKRTRLVANVQDVYPDAAVDLGFLKNPTLISFFRKMERYVYRKASRIVVISDGFKKNLIAKGVPDSKVDIVFNWADTDSILPGEPDPGLRSKLGIKPDEFAVIYSGGLTNNSCVERLIEAAIRMQDEKVRFVIVGNGAREGALKQMVTDNNLSNVSFHPFQPLELYPDVLRASDLSVVTLSRDAAKVSVPSKVYKQMAAGRPILVIASTENELTRMINVAEAGVTVSSDSPEEVCAAIRKVIGNREAGRLMGANAREFVVKNCSRPVCVKLIEKSLKVAVEQAL